MPCTLGSAWGYGKCWLVVSGVQMATMEGGAGSAETQSQAPHQVAQSQPAIQIAQPSSSYGLELSKPKVFTVILM